MAMKIAVAGLGRIGWKFHFRESVASPDFDLVAVVDPLEERRSEAEVESGCRSYETFDELLAKETLDVVAIATPTTFHEVHTVAALEHGCHVILEKPLSTSLASADRMIEAADRAVRRITVYQPHRLRPDTIALKTAMGSGKMGPIHQIRRGVYRYVRRSDWQSLQKHGGGMLNNYGAHYIDLLLHLSDDTPVVDVRCSRWAVATRGDADDVVRVWVRKESGQLLDVEINQASACPMPEWNICGKYGTLVDADGKTFQMRYYDPAEAAPLEVIEGAAPGRSYDNQDRLPWQEETVHPVGEGLDFYANFRDVITKGATPLIPIEETREVVRVMDLCRRDSGPAMKKEE